MSKESAVGGRFGDHMDPRIRPPAMDDNNLPIDEEGEGMCETGWTTGYGIPARFAAHVQQDRRPELAEKHRADSFLPWLWLLSNLLRAAIVLVVRSWS